MATQIKTWQIVNGKLKEIEIKLSDTGRTEAYDLENWIISNPTIIDQDLTIIGRQVQTSSGPLDLLALDRSGNSVIIELKRDKLPREVLAQAIDYSSDVATWTIDKLSEICTKFIDKSLEDTLSESFPEENLEKIVVSLSESIRNIGQFNISFYGTGIFPNLHRPRIVWLGIKQGKDKLKEIAKIIEDEMFLLYFPREKREFSAHLTLGRLRSQKNRSAIIKKVIANEKIEVGSELISSIDLMQSALHPTGLDYKCLKSVPV